MNYYIQGNKEKADQIKAAFEELGYDTKEFDFSCGLFFTVGRDVHYWSHCVIDVFKTHPDYKELELPKPHYDIANFKPYQKVLIRFGNNDTWRADFFSHIKEDRGRYFVGIGYANKQCIPFEGNEHLLGTTDMPSEEYINW